jgi:putative hydrolase of the HAD superfamily
MRDARYQPPAHDAVSAVVFDAMGTLVHLLAPAPALQRELAARHGIVVSRAAARRAIRAEIAHYLTHHLTARDRASLTTLRLQCARIIGEQLGGEATALADGQLLAVLMASLRFRAYGDAAGALRALRRRQLPIAVASNWDVSLPDVLDAVGLAPLIDVVVTSAQVGASKPEARVISSALDALGVPADRAVHVGDSLAADVEGARAAGVRPVLVRRSGPAEMPGVTVVRSLSRLAALVDGNITW